MKKIWTSNIGQPAVNYTIFRPWKQAMLESWHGIGISSYLPACPTVD